MRQIARVLAVTPAAVYRHFPDKASLLANLKTTIQAEVTATLRIGSWTRPMHQRCFGKW
ncbi:TetR/AcrR family transcriptional regulator [Levilactobacillus brevis]|nr:TetR/AcrR family transcriptional regulator [Levilactobacillus brevis]